jgi:hypothetical protein
MRADAKHYFVYGMAKSTVEWADPRQGFSFFSGENGF